MALPQDNPHPIAHHPIVLAIFDPAWLFLVSGLAILAACFVVPAQDRRDEVRWLQGRAGAMLDHGELRAERYEILEAALDRGDASLAKALVASQLNLVPAKDLGQIGGQRGSAIVLASSAPNANVLASVEPELTTPPTRSSARRVRDTRLRRLVTDPASRLGLLIAGCVSVAFGLFYSRPNR